MNYRHLGNSGLKVSEVALGSWLTYGNSVGRQGAKACVEAAFERGVNFFDTANVYAAGEAERMLGGILAGYSRSDYVIATKCFFPMGSGPNDRGLSRKHLFEQMRASLARLNLDYVDLYQCHRYDVETPLEETLLALDQLADEGHCLYVGFSEWPADKIIEARKLQAELGLHKFVSSQPQYSMLWRHPEAEVFPACRKLGIGQIVWSPLAQGVLTGKYSKGKSVPANSRASNAKSSGWMARVLGDANLAVVERLKPIAKEQGLTLAQLALSWCLRRDELSSVIIGASAPAQVAEDCGVKPLGKTAIADIEAALI